MNSLLQLFFAKLSEHLFSLIGGSVATQATAYRAIAQAEQQSLLEDLARQYEAEGKQDLANHLRRQASLIATGDPTGEGKQILLQVIDQKTESVPLLGTEAGSSSDHPALPATRRRRGNRRAGTSLPDAIETDE